MKEGATKISMNETYTCKMIASLLMKVTWPALISLKNGCFEVPNRLLKVNISAAYLFLGTRVVQILEESRFGTFT